MAIFSAGKLLMTPFQQLVVPPPMSAYYLQLPASINLVTFCCHGNTDDALLSLDDGRIAVYRFDSRCLTRKLRQIKVNDKIETADSVYIHIAGQDNAIFEKMNTMCLFTPVVI